MAAGGAHASPKFLSSLLKVLVSLVASGGNGGAVGVVGIVPYHGGGRRK